ncbi:SDR family NAD(P)-dependent oxidoreductase [Salinarchaeum laminariae]|uniref:SDR family NAD(P)-dependent oxidoreductase n=1 Tax=Salinarchaeum laminariae TaxID=869888 RepID=UPI0020BE8280|nr:glucose 1-dehydrogenase [Salinarchaeum laminariae]
MSILDQFRLDGRTAIVTGGNRGIGRAIADGLADVGANVVIANRDAAAGDRAAEEIADEFGVQTLAVPTDVTEESDVQAMVDRTVDEFGGVDILINNAGIVQHNAVEEKSVAEFQHTLDVNLTGAYRTAKYVGEVMREGGGGVLINVSSMSAFVANYPKHQVDYQASKGGLEALKNQLASEWAEDDIRVNNVNPGFVDTGLDAEADEQLETWRSEMLVDEFAEPEAIAPLVVYLASDASSYVTGESVVIDGGYTVR